MQPDILQGDTGDDSSRYDIPAHLFKQLIIHCKELMFKFRHCRSIWVGHSKINKRNVHGERQNEFM